MTVSAVSMNKKIEDPVHDLIKRSANILISGGLTWLDVCELWGLENIVLSCCIE